MDKTLIALSATSGGVSIISFTSVFGAPVFGAPVLRKFYFNFFSNNRTSQKITHHNKKQKGKAS